MKLIAYLYDNGHLLWLAFILILVAGISALVVLPRQEDPRITNRNAIIITTFPGASSERVETLVTEVIEEELQQIPEIKEITSTSRAGVSVVSIALIDAVTDETNDQILSEARDRLNDATVRLPAGASDPMFDDQRGAVAFTLIAGVTWRADGDAQLIAMRRLAEDLADALRNVEGTEIVRIYGDVTEQITVKLDPTRTTDLGLDPVAVAGLIEAADAKVPAGVLRSENHNIALEVDGAFTTADRVREIPLLRDDAGQVIRVGDVARVERGHRDPPTEVGSTDGRRTVFVAARMSQGEQVRRWAEDAGAVLDDFQPRTGTQMSLDVVFDQNTYTSARLGELAFNVLLGMIVVVIVTLFTMGWRSAMMVGAAIPLVASLVLFALEINGSALHQMSIFGMIIALGLLVDNAIVVVDEVSTRLREGASGREATVGAVEHLFTPLASSTLTTVLAFSPIVLLPGNAGDFVGHIGLSVILAIIASFAVSMTLIAVVTGRLGRSGGGTDSGRKGVPGFRWLGGGLPGGPLKWLTRRTLRVGLRVPVALILLACGPALVGFALAPTLGSQFFPPVDRDMFDLKVWLPRDASVERTRATMAGIESAIRADAEVERVDWLAGGSFPSVYYNLVMNQDNAPYFAQAAIKSSSPEATQRLIPALQASIGDRFPEAQVLFRQFGQGPPVEADVQYRLYGPDLATLQDLGERLRRALQEHEDVLHTQMTVPRGQPKLWVEADEDQLRQAGMELTGVSGQLALASEGVRAGSVLESVEEMAVRVRYDDRWRTDTGRIASTNVIPAQMRGGEWVPLTAVATLRLRPETAGISHFDGLRVNTVEGFTRNEALPIEVTRTVLERVKSEGFELPAGYTLTLGGAVEQESDAVGNLMTYVPVLGVIMVASLILAFRSVKLALVLLVVAGMSVGLGQLATWAISFPVSFNTILGTLGLIGVALNDSIVVLAAIRANPDARAGDHEAIIHEVLGCGRHVISTTLTTIGGFLPLLLLIGGDFWPSLAIVLAGGVLGSTLMAVFFIPSAYVLVTGAWRRG